MWYDILPSFVIVAAAVAAPHGIAYGMNWLVNGNCYRRSLAVEELRLQYLRNIRLTGDAYKCVGLENIPDEDECPVEQLDEECEEDKGEANGGDEEE